MMNKPLYIISYFFLFLVNKGFCQKATTIISSDFAIRDFSISEDSIFYIKKRDAFLFDKFDYSQEHYFIGGYGLEIHTRYNSNTIITASNELVRNVSSVRFYNKKTKKFDNVFYYKEGKIIDFLLIPEAELFVLSLTNKKIVFIDYSKRPKFYKTIELKLNALSRKLIYKKNTLYFVTDIGEIYQYNFHDYKKKLLYNSKQLITDFEIETNILVYTTINGDIVKRNLNTNTFKKQNIKNNFISTFIKVNNNTLVCGSWNGKVYIIDYNTFKIIKELTFHKRAILTIKKDKNNTIYSSSLDKTIKKWTIN